MPPGRRRPPGKRGKKCAAPVRHKRAPARRQAPRPAPRSTPKNRIWRAWAACAEAPIDALSFTFLDNSALRTRGVPPCAKVRGLFCAALRSPGPRTPIFFPCGSAERLSRPARESDGRRQPSDEKKKPAALCMPNVLSPLPRRGEESSSGNRGFGRRPNRLESAARRARAQARCADQGKQLFF